MFATSSGAPDAIVQMSGAGPPRVGELCGIPWGLRVRNVIGFPCGWFSFATFARADTQQE